MEQTLDQLRTQALAELDASSDEQTVEALRVKYLGRTGSISQLSEGMKTLEQVRRLAPVDRIMRCQRMQRRV